MKDNTTGKKVRVVDWLRSERDAKLSGGLYHITQVRFAFNSNHMEGSTLSPEQTAQLYDTGTLGTNGEEIRADDVIEAVNHFRAFDWMLDHVDEPVDEEFVTALHALLKRGTVQERDPGFNVGGYKLRPNVIGAGLSDTHTVLPEDVPAAMEHVFELYASLEDDPFRIAQAHWMFETTHPFSDGNGRVGRLVVFKELLRIDAMPLIVRDENRGMYVRGLSEFPDEPGYLIDTLLFERDYYQSIIEQLAADPLKCTYNDSWERSAVESLAESGKIVNPFIKKEWSREVFGNKASIAERAREDSAKPVRFKHRHAR